MLDIKRNISIILISVLASFQIAVVTGAEKISKTPSAYINEGMEIERKLWDRFNRKEKIERHESRAIKMQAIEKYSKAIELEGATNKEKSDALFRRGSAYWLLSNSDQRYKKEAYKSLKQSVKYDDKNPMPLEALAVIYELDGDLLSSLKNYNRAIELLPHKLDLYGGRSSIRFQLTNYKGAEEDLRLAIKKDKNNFMYFKRLSEALAHQGKLDESIVYAEKSIGVLNDLLIVMGAPKGMSPALEDLYTILGNNYKKKGNNEWAIKYYSKALGENPRIIELAKKQVNSIDRILLKRLAATPTTKEWDKHRWELVYLIYTGDTDARSIGVDVLARVDPKKAKHDDDYSRSLARALSQKEWLWAVLKKKPIGIQDKVVGYFDLFPEDYIGYDRKYYERRKQQLVESRQRQY